MQPEKLVMMVNQIAEFFAAQGQVRAVPQIASLGPRMRREIAAMRPRRSRPSSACRSRSAQHCLRDPALECSRNAHNAHRRAIRSHPRSLLSIARLNSAKSLAPDAACLGWTTPGRDAAAASARSVCPAYDLREQCRLHEARRDGQYHVVDRWIGTDDLESIGRFFLDLAGLGDVERVH
jgi:hypothetical protein